MSDEVFDILREAVNIARFYQIQRLSTLRDRLSARFPGKDAEITEALTTWAEYERSKH